MVDVSGGHVRGRPRLGWMDGVKMVVKELKFYNSLVTSK